MGLDVEVVKEDLKKLFAVFLGSVVVLMLLALFAEFSGKIDYVPEIVEMGFSVVVLIFYGYVGLSWLRNRYWVDE